MKKFFLVSIATLFAFSAVAGHIYELNPNAKHFKAKNQAGGKARPSSNLTYHNGPVMHGTKVVAIFWGPSWTGADAATATTIRNFISFLGTSSHTAMITQYYDIVGGVKSNIQQSALGNVAWFDSSTPPVNCTDAVVQGEVSKYLAQSGVVTDSSTIYEVFLPKGSYSSDGTSTSCGGPHLAYCAYHSNYSHNGKDVKYSSEPYPSCSGCSNTGWSAAQNMTMFVGHETREAWTDPDGTAWWDRSGNEADDKCAWTSLFTDSGFGLQPEWSNAVSGCVK